VVVAMVVLVLVLVDEDERGRDERTTINRAVVTKCLPRFDRPRATELQISRARRSHLGDPFSLKSCRDSANRNVVAISTLERKTIGPPARFVDATNSERNPSFHVSTNPSPESSPITLILVSRGPVQPRWGEPRHYGHDAPFVWFCWARTTTCQPIVRHGDGSVMRSGSVVLVCLVVVVGFEGDIALGRMDIFSIEAHNANKISQHRPRVNGAFRWSEL
jgi:hypothetical protein